MQRGLLALTLTAGFLGAGCLVQIDHVSDPEPAFREARREAQRLQGKPGPARELNVLVYDDDDRKLVRVSLPMWLVRKIERRVDFDKELDFDDDDRDGRERAQRAVRRHLRFKDIEKAGLGVLIEVEEEDGEKVLVWLR